MARLFTPTGAERGPSPRLKWGSCFSPVPSLKANALSFAERAEASTAPTASKALAAPGSGAALPFSFIAVYEQRCFINCSASAELSG